MDVEVRLAELGIQLPEPAKAVGSYVLGVVVGELLFLAGHIPIDGQGRATTQGKVGRDLSAEEAYGVAREVAINSLGSARGILGDLDEVKRVVKVLGMVNCVEGFTDTPKVINGFSDLLIEVFGEHGRHARSAVGVAELPMGVPVEVEMILQVATGR